ncbi:hypothetical protein [Streptomyces sp. NPDC055709]
MARNSINQRAIEKHLKEIAKGYERAARRNPIRVPIQTETSAEGGSVPGRDTAEGDPILARLLMWLDEQAQLNPSHYIDVTRFVEEQQMHGEDASVLAFELEQRDLVRVARTMGGTPDVHLIDAGRAAIHRLKKLRQDRAARLRYTMDAFQRWLFDTVDDPEARQPGAVPRHSRRLLRWIRDHWNRAARSARPPDRAQADRTHRHRPRHGRHHTPGRQLRPGRRKPAGPHQPAPPRQHVQQLHAERQGRHHR